MKHLNLIFGIVFAIISFVYLFSGYDTMALWHLILSLVNFLTWVLGKIKDQLDEIQNELNNR